MAAAHFDAELRPGPDVPDGPPDHVLVQVVHKVIDHLLELLQVTRLNSAELCLAVAPEEVVKGRLIRAGQGIAVLPEITRVPNFSRIHSSNRLEV